MTADPRPVPADVIVVEYDPRWPALFAAESARVRAACGDGLVGIEHVGSTSVPGLAAKPIIDIIVFLQSFEAGAAVVRGMEALGYEYRGEYGVPGRHYFRQTRPPRSAHVHMYAAGHPDALRLIAFRDALRADDQLRDAYAAVKRDNARAYPHSSMLYTGAKSGFIERVNRRIAGTPPEPIVVVDYDLAWPELYDAEAARIREALGGRIAGIEHIGSTSVPGLAAKPIVDIMPLVESFEAAEELVAPMEMLGYHYFGEYGIPRRHFFNRPGYHIHVLEPGSDQAAGHVAFRDYLRAHPGTASAYARLSATSRNGTATTAMPTPMPKRSSFAPSSPRRGAPAPPNRESRVGILSVAACAMRHRTAPRSTSIAPGASGHRGPRLQDHIPPASRRCFCDSPETPPRATVTAQTASHRYGGGIPKGG